MLHSNLGEHKSSGCKSGLLSLSSTQLMLFIFSYHSQPKTSLPQSDTPNAAPNPMCLPLKVSLWAGWRDSSAAALPEDLPSRTQHLHGGSKLSPVPRDSMPYSVSAGIRHACGVQTDKTHRYIKTFTVSLPYEIWKAHRNSNTLTLRIMLKISPVQQMLTASDLRIRVFTQF